LLEVSVGLTLLSVRIGGENRQTVWSAFGH
jgi:hypothetical protein